MNVNDNFSTLGLDWVADSADASKGLGQFQGAARGRSRFSEGAAHPQTWIEQFSNDDPES
jgi:hypothetical protein